MASTSALTRSESRILDKTEVAKLEALGKLAKALKYLDNGIAQLNHIRKVKGPIPILDSIANLS